MVVIKNIFRRGIKERASSKSPVQEGSLLVGTERGKISFEKKMEKFSETPTVWFFIPNSSFLSPTQAKETCGEQNAGEWLVVV